VQWAQNVAANKLINMSTTIESTTHEEVANDLAQD
jgi:hypothetical protein